MKTFSVSQVLQGASSYKLPFAMAAKGDRATVAAGGSVSIITHSFVPNLRLNLIAP